MHKNSELIFDKYALQHFAAHKRVLEIGPDRFPSTYQARVHGAFSSWDTIDIAASDGLTHVMKSEYEFPLPSDHYDIVLSGQVIEHVRKPWVWVKEVARVCKPGGLVITISPVSWPYHEAPIDCWRAFPEGMQALYEEAGLDTLLCRFEALENQSTRKLPGMSLEFQPAKRRLVNKLFRSINFYNECAFDLITVGRKL